MPRKHKSTATSDLPAAALRSFSEAGAKAEAAPGMGKPGMAAPGMGKPGMAAPGMGKPDMGKPGMGKPARAGTGGRDERDE